MAKKRRKGRRGTSGVGQLITVRRMGTAGLGQLNKPGSFAGSALPPLIGAGVTGIATLATRYFVKPSEGETQKMLFKWAPALGLGAGVLSSLALYWLGGAPAMLSSGMGSLATAGTLLAHDQLVSSKAGEFAMATGAPAAAGTGGYRYRTGVVVPEQVGTRGIMLEPTASRDPNNRYGVMGIGDAAPFGEQVSLSGIKPTAFGRTHLGN
jgi:hypothetical protein